MSIPQIISLLEFCLTHTYTLFQGKYYEQVQGAAMGSPISPLIANIFMEEFEVKALQSFPHPPSLWLRFVDDTFVINKAEHSQDLLQHINSQDSHIQFTVEPTQQGSLPFLDTLVTIQPDKHIQHRRLQEAHTHRPKPLLGQQPPHHCQTKRVQYLSPQSQNSVFNPGQSPKGTHTHQNSPPSLPVPLLGPQPVGAQVQPDTTPYSPRQQQQQQQLIQQQPNTKQP